MPPKFSSIALWAGLGMIAASVYFFLVAISLMSQLVPAVVAALLSAIIGFVMLSAGTSLIRTYVVSRVLEGEGDVTKKP